MKHTATLKIPRQRKSQQKNSVDNEKKPAWLSRQHGIQLKLGIWARVVAVFKIPTLPRVAPAWLTKQALLVWATWWLKCLRCQLHAMPRTQTVLKAITKFLEAPTSGSGIQRTPPDILLSQRQTRSVSKFWFQLGKPTIFAFKFRLTVFDKKLKIWKIRKT